LSYSQKVFCWITHFTASWQDLFLLLSCNISVPYLAVNQRVGTVLLVELRSKLAHKYNDIGINVGKPTECKSETKPAGEIDTVWNFTSAVLMLVSVLFWSGILLVIVPSMTISRPEVVQFQELHDA
jgi:hypothetical protein